MASGVDQAFAERVLDLVEHIPTGLVLPYGRIAEHLEQGFGPRYVGRVMSLYGESVAWWRVPRTDGTLPAPLMSRAQRHWLAENTPVRNGRVDMVRALWQLD